MEQIVKGLRVPAALLAMALGAGLALAGPGEGVRVGYLTMHPFVDGSGTYDSNVGLVRTNEQDDVFYDAQGGVDFSYEPSWGRIDGRGFVLHRWYTDFTDKDFENAGERVSAHAGKRDTLSVIVEQSYRRIDDYDRSTYFGEPINPESRDVSLTYDRSMRLRRTLNDFGAVLGRQLTERVGVDVGGSYSEQDYSDRRLYDTDEKRGQIEAGYRLTDKTDGLLTLQYRREHNASFAGDADAFVIRGGLKTRSTDKLTFKAGAGLEDYQREGADGAPNTTGNYSAAQRDGGDESYFSFDVAGTWIATEKLTLELSGRNGVQSAPQYANTANRVTVTSLSELYRLLEPLTLSLTGSYRQDDYLDPVQEGGLVWDREDNRWAGLLRADYTPRAKFATVYGEIGYENDDSTIPEYRYDQLRAGLGVSVRY